MVDNDLVGLLGIYAMRDIGRYENNTKNDNLPCQVDGGISSTLFKNKGE